MNLSYKNLVTTVEGRAELRRCCKETLADLQNHRVLRVMAAGIRGDSDVILAAIDVIDRQAELIGYVYLYLQEAQCPTGELAADECIQAAIDKIREVMEP